MVGLVELVELEELVELVEFVPKKDLHKGSKIAIYMVFMGAF